MGNKIINISEQLYNRLKTTSEDFGFESVDEYVNFVLEEIIKNEEANEGKPTKEEKEEISKGLRKLGYED